MKSIKPDFPRRKRASSCVLFKITVSHFQVLPLYLTPELNLSLRSPRPHIDEVCLRLLYFCNESVKPAFACYFEGDKVV